MTKILPLDDLPQIASGTAQGVIGGDASGEFDDIAGGVITIGNFDGVHRGHASLLGKVRGLADQLGVPAVAVVLDPHPVTILRPEVAHKRLTSIERRAELMSQHGINALVVCRVTPRFLGLTATQFFESLVVGKLKAVGMLEGPNFFFGRDRGGDLAVLSQLCQQHGVELRVVEPTSQGDQMISSTRVRRLLESGNLAEAADLLGTHYQLSGTVVAGAKRGRQIGFPTANLENIDMVVPSPGVYGGYARAAGAKRQYSAAINIGPNPTFEQDGESKVEVHLLDYDDGEL